jgi:hypothetical protein
MVASGSAGTGAGVVTGTVGGGTYLSLAGFSGSFAGSSVMGAGSGALSALSAGFATGGGGGRELQSSARAAEPRQRVNKASEAVRRRDMITPSKRGHIPKGAPIIEKVWRFQAFIVVAASLR